jgi:hypothetical protein
VKDRQPKRNFITNVINSIKFNNYFIILPLLFYVGSDGPEKHFNAEYKGKDLPVLKVTERPRSFFLPPNNG